MKQIQKPKRFTTMTLAQDIDSCNREIVSLLNYEWDVRDDKICAIEQIVTRWFDRAPEDPSGDCEGCVFRDTNCYMPIALCHNGIWVEQKKYVK